MRLDTVSGPNPTVMHWARARVPMQEDVAEPFHDGDTIWLEIDRGFRDHSTRDLRLYGVFAPELKQLPGGPDTRDYVIGWLRAASAEVPSNHWPLQVDTVRIAGGDHEATTLERYLAIVYNADRSMCLNDDVMAYVKANGYPGGTGS